MMPLADLTGARRNPKKHADKAISTSIGRFGYVEPIVIDERTNRLVAGHGRMQALRVAKTNGDAPPEGVENRQGEWFVPVLRGWASRSDAEADAYLLASNRLVELGGWSNFELGSMLTELAQQNALDGVGYDAAAIDAVLKAASAEGPPVTGLTDPDEAPPVPAESWVKLGDMFALGGHRIICGDCTNADVVTRLMDGGQADVCWTDPPWNVAYGKSTNPAGWSNKHTPIANDALGDKFPAFCSGFCARIADVTKPGAPLYMAMSAQEWPTIHEALVRSGFHWSSTIIWAKDSLVLSRKDYHTQYEPIWYGWKEGHARLVEVKDRKQSDLWAIARPKKSDEHPTMKPIELVERSLENSSHIGGVVFEPFSGSGTTILASERIGRKARAVELEPKYVQVALERWEAFTGRKAERIE